MVRRRRTWWGVGCGLLAALVVLISSQGADSPPSLEPGPRLQLDIKMDKRVYTQADTVSVTVTVSNLGSGPAERVVVDCDEDKAGEEHLVAQPLADGEDWIRLDTNRLGDLGSAPGAFIPPSDARHGTASGVVSPSAYNVGTVAVRCVMSYTGSDRPLSTAVAAATVAGTSNVVKGRFGVCQHDSHGRFTTDRGAAGVRLTLQRGPDNSGQPPPGPWSTVTDVDGRFAFPVVATGPYVLTYQPPARFEPINHPDVPRNTVDLLVTGADVRWQADPLMVTTADPETRCDA